MWTGKFVEVLSTGPKDGQGKTEKRKDRDDDDNDVDDKAKRRTFDKTMQRLAQVDSSLINNFDFEKDKEVDAYKSLANYRYDALVEFQKANEPFESVTHYLFAEGQKALFYEIAKPFGLPLMELTPTQMTDDYRRRSPQYVIQNADGTYTPGNTDVETFFLLLTRPSMEIIAAKRASDSDDFVVAMLALVFARFETTDAIKLLLKKITKQYRETSAFDDLIRPQLLGDFFVELSKQQRAFKIETHISGVADLVKIRILSYLEKEDFIRYCKTEKVIQKKCESGEWKNIIAVLRFERQFGKDSDEVMQLRYRFYDETVTNRSFLYAAIRAEKFLIKEYTNGQLDVGRLVTHLNPELDFSETRDDARLEMPVLMWLLGRRDPVYAKTIFDLLIRRINPDSLIDKEGLIYDDSNFFETLKSMDNWLFVLLDGFTVETVRKIYKANKQDPAWVTAAERLSDGGNTEQGTDNLIGHDSYYYLFDALSRNGFVKAVDRLLIAGRLSIRGADIMRDVRKNYSLIKNKAIWNEIIRRKLATEVESWSEEFRYVEAILRLHCSNSLEEDIRESALERVVSDFTREVDSIFIFNSGSYYEACNRSDIWIRIIREISLTDKPQKSEYRYSIIALSLMVLNNNDGVQGKEFLSNDIVPQYITNRKTPQYDRYARFTLDDWVELYPNVAFWLPILRTLYNTKSFRVVAEAVIRLDSKSTLPADVRLFFARKIVYEPKNHSASYMIEWGRKALGLPLLESK